MTHDPMCQTVRNTEMSEVFCDCEWIARVREDERDKHADCRCHELEAMVVANGRYESVSIDGQLLERPDVTRTEALRDAVEAVKARCSSDGEFMCVECEASVAAIEALGETE